MDDDGTLIHPERMGRFLRPSIADPSLPFDRSLVVLYGDNTWRPPSGGGGGGTVTSVALAAPSEFNVAGSPIILAGTITLSWVNENANLVFAGPATGVPAVPTFRALVAADIPSLPYGTGTVTSVDMTVPTSELAISGNPITTSGTLVLTWQTQTANKVFAGPTSGGAATPTFRVLVASDIPSIANLTDPINQTAHGFVVGDVVKFAGGVYAKAQADSAANAEVVGLVVVVVDANNFFLLTTGYTTVLSGLVAGTTYFLSPTTAGLLTATEPTTSTQVTKPLLVAVSTTTGYFMNMRGLVIGSTATQAANTFYAGPTSGAAAIPAFRAITVADLPIVASASIALFNYQNFV